MTSSTKKPKKSPRKVLVGIPTSPGYGMGRAFPVIRREITVQEETILASQVPLEERIFFKAIEKTSAEISQIKELSESRNGVKNSLIFSTHLMILKDPRMVSAVRDLIKKEHKNARWAVHKVLTNFIETFENINSAAMRDKTADLRDLYNRLMSAMDDSLSDLNQISIGKDAVLSAHEFLPSFIMSLKPGTVNALVMDTGGLTSHVSILARSLQIPAVFGLQNISALVGPNDFLLVDGSDGKVIINPNDEDLHAFEERQNLFERQRRELFTMRRLEPMTRDGKYITLHANIELPNEAPKIVDFGATGIGLYRSEFLFFQSSIPTQKEQEEAYRTVLETMAPHPVTIRTLDAGGDKLVPGLSSSNEANPFMGWRSIRVCLDREDIFNTQLKALLLANKTGNLRLLLPMISGVEELRRAKACIKKARRELEEMGEKIPEVKVGIMIEVPAAVMLVDQLAKEVDFFSIGTNDLIQFTLAVDRTNELITDMFEPHHPAILKMIYQTVLAAHRQGIPVAVCGEMSADPFSVLLLVGLGVDELSMIPWNVMTTKKIIRSMNFEDVRETALKVLEMNDANAVNEYLFQKYSQLVGDLGLSSFLTKKHK